MLNPNRAILRHIIIKLSKDKDKEIIFKVAREKREVTYKGSSIIISADFSTETFQARKEWDDIFKILRGKKTNCQPEYYSW